MLRHLLALTVFLTVPSLYAADSLPTAEVYKSPTCSCCGKWEAHLRENGFKVESHPTADMAAVKTKYHIPSKAKACHTAVIGNYTVEGHVPADSIKKLLQEKPKDVVGIAVAGMPAGSPGMESNTPEHYDILSFDAQGNTKVFDHR